MTRELIEVSAQGLPFTLRASADAVIRQKAIDQSRTVQHGARVCRSRRRAARGETAIELIHRIFEIEHQAIQIFSAIVAAVGRVLNRALKIVGASLNAADGISDGCFAGKLGCANAGGARNYEQHQECLESGFSDSFHLFFLLRSNRGLSTGVPEVEQGTNMQRLRGIYGEGDTISYGLVR